MRKMDKTNLWADSKKTTEEKGVAKVENSATLCI